MALENPPSLPHAHQQIRLGDIQASIHKWSKAIEYYLCAIEYFKAIQQMLHDTNLISNIEAQIIQCEKTIELCRLKHRSEEAASLQQKDRLSKISRAKSISNMNSSTKPNRIMSRHNTLQLENGVTLDDYGAKDSLAAYIFPKNHKPNETSPKQTPIVAKKKQKHESLIIEELQMSSEALKIHLKEAFDAIERLKNENNQLRLQREPNITEDHNQSKSLTSSEEDYSANELEATL